MTFSKIAQLVKERINCLDYAKDQGIDLKSSGDTYRAISPFEGGNNKTCFTIYKDNPDYFEDWKADLRGDVIDFAANLNYNGDKVAALQELKEKTGITATKLNTSDLENFNIELNKRTDKVNYWHSELMKNQYFLNYIHSRNITDQTIKALKIGISDKRKRIMIPYFKQGKIVYYVGRLFPNYTISEDNPKYQKAKIDGYNQHICWGIDTLNRKTPLIIAEGAFDAISFYQEGYAVLSPMGGSFNKDQLKTVIGAARSPLHDETILIFDTDTAGQTFTRKLAKTLFENGIKFKTATVPNFKDVSEYYTANKELTGILETAVDGLFYLASTFQDDKEGFRKFILSAARHLQNPDIVELFAELRKNNIFHKDWLKELERQCKATPAETVIVNEILNKHHLLYTETGGFYMFNGLVWNKKDDSAIKRIISKHLGKFATGAKVSSILNLLSADCYEPIEFNKKRLMTFQNGTLELDTKKFRKPRYDDYINILLPYEYDPAATAPTWERFIKDVTAGNEEKMLLLQEIAGYCLFPENSLQKCVNLIGDGGNGKSVFVGELRELFGNDNVSTVQVSDLDNQFSRIHLKDSLINICTEEKPNVKNADGVFKNLTAGDPIDGCFKRKDILSFVPHAKLIVASNDYVVFNDTSDAIIRRMLFVEFTEKFVTDREPKNKREHKGDIYLPDKLKKELSGVFNWLMAGYDRLRKIKRFTETEESINIKKNYHEIINPMILFIKSLELGSRTKIITSLFYEEYKIWASNNGFSQMNSNTFAKRFNATFNKVYPNWHKKHFKDGNGWEIDEL